MYGEEFTIRLRGESSETFQWVITSTPGLRLFNSGMDISNNNADTNVGYFWTFIPEARDSQMIQAVYTNLEHVENIQQYYVTIL